MSIINVKNLVKETDALEKYFIKRDLTNAEVDAVLREFIYVDQSIRMLDIVDEKIKEALKNGKHTNKRVKKRKK